MTRDLVSVAEREGFEGEGRVFSVCSVGRRREGFGGEGRGFTVCSVGRRRR